MSNRPALIGFETRLLAELRQVVAERAAALPDPAARGLAEPAAPTRPAAHPWPRRRLALTGALSAAVAVGLAVALTVARPGSAPPAGPGFAAPTNAAAILNNAALAALREPAVIPRPDQFVYTRMFETDDQAAFRGDPAEHSVQTDESWTSVSGTREGRSVETFSENHQPPRRLKPLIESWCEGGTVHPTPPHSKPPKPCTPQEFAAYLPGLPTTAAAMLTYLAHHNFSSPNPVDRAGILLAGSFYLLTTVDLTPAQQAAVFRALVRIPHLEIVPKATDALGRTGVGIRLLDHGDSWTAIFDPDTFRPLGANVTSRVVDHRVAVAVPATIVDRVGQRP